MFHRTLRKSTAASQRVNHPQPATGVNTLPANSTGEGQPSPNAAASKQRTKHLGRLQSTSTVVRLAKEIKFKTRLPAPTTGNLDRLVTTTGTLVGGVNHIKKKVDDACVANLTRPGHEHPDWQVFARKAAVKLPKRRTPEEQEKITAARKAEDEKDKKLPMAELVAKYIQAAEKAKQKKADDRKAQSKLDVLTSGLDTRGDPDLEEAERGLSSDERKLAPLLSAVKDAFKCSNALLLLLSANTPEAQKLSTALKAALKEQKDDLTLQTASPEDLPGQLLVQPFSRLGLLTRDFKEHWDAAEVARRGLEAIRDAGGEPTAEQLEGAAKAQKRLLACAGEIITSYDHTFHRLFTAGKLFAGAQDLPADQLKAVQEYGEKLLDYAAMLAVPSSLPMQLKAMAHSVVEADAAAKARAQESVPVVPSNNTAAATGHAPQLPSNPAPMGQSAEQAKALVVEAGLPVRLMQGVSGRIHRVLPLPPVRGLSPAAA